MLRTNIYLPITASLGLLLSASMNAQEVIIDNNFDTLDTGVYSNGSAFTSGGSAAGATFGHASSTKDGTSEVVSSVGLGDTSALNGKDAAFRSGSTASISTGASFSLYFQFDGNDDMAPGRFNGAVIGTGFSIANDTQPAFNFGENDRFLVGLVQANNSDQADVQFGAFGKLGEQDVFTSAPVMTLTEQNWYNLSFDLSQTEQGWSIESLSLTGYTQDISGNVTPSGEAWSMSTITGYSSTLFGSSLDSVDDAYAFIAMNTERGGANIDNVLVSSIPESSSYALILSVFCAIAVTTRRNR